MLGWIGSIFFSIGPLAQAREVYRTGQASQFSWLFLISWFMGEFCYTVYTIDKIGIGDIALPFLVNYIANYVALAVLMYYKWIGRNDERDNNN